MAVNEKKAAYDKAYRSDQLKTGKMVQMAFDVTPDEKAMIQAAAKARGLSAKKYILALVERDNPTT